MNKILLLGFHHGNEQLGKHLYTYIRSRRPDLLHHTHYLVANPRAMARGVRYLESDMNRSYTGEGTTYEERRAAQVLRQIRQHNYALVLDLHTTTCNQPPCFIAADPLANGGFLMASSIAKVVHMKHPVVETSLIGNYQRAVSIEINEEEAKQPQTLDALCNDITRFLRGEIYREEKEVYEVTDLLKKSEISEQRAAKLRNFTRASDGFYPVLVGENSYKKQTDYLGFKASRYLKVNYKMVQ